MGDTMTYKARRKVTTRMVELRSSGAQSVSDGDKVLFPNKITTGGDSVSISGTGVITLSSSHSYYIAVATGATRPSSSSDFSLEFYNETAGTKLVRSDGAFEARYLPTDATNGFRNGSTVGQLRIDNPSHTISVRVNQLGASSATIEDNCHLFIIEMEY